MNTQQTIETATKVLPWIIAGVAAWKLYRLAKFGAELVTENAHKVNPADERNLINSGVTGVLQNTGIIGADQSIGTAFYDFIHGSDS